MLINVIHMKSMRYIPYCSILAIEKKLTLPAHKTTAGDASLDNWGDGCVGVVTAFID